MVEDVAQSPQPLVFIAIAGARELDATKNPDDEFSRQIRIATGQADVIDAAQVKRIVLRLIPIAVAQAWNRN